MTEWTRGLWNRGAGAVRLGLLLAFGLLLGLPALGVGADNTAQNEPGGDSALAAPLLGTSRAVNPADALADPLNPAAVLYEQFDNQSLNLAGSQQFEPTFSRYDDQTADDFTVPGGETWVIDQVQVAGSYSSSGHADAVNIFFYAASGSMPGTPLVGQTDLSPSSGLDNGSFVIPLDPPVTLPPGTYWLSVQAHQRYDPNGQWFWRNRQSPALGHPAAWRNPANGFSRCSGWNTRYYCGVSGYLDPDQVFRLYGVSNATPTPTPPGTPATPTRTRTPLPVPPTVTASPGLPPPVLTQSAPFTPAPPTVDPTPIPPCVVQWRVVAGPNGAVGSASSLQSVAAVSATDVWAVGSVYGSSAETLIAHWDGQGWLRVPSPNVGTASNYLTGIDAVAANDIWAVGDYADPALAQHLPLLLHWTGATWNVVPGPALVGYAQLRAVVALAADDAWAVGQLDAATLTLHWDGTSWVQVPTPFTWSASTLAAVSATALDDVWAVGTSNSSFLIRPLILHWDGTIWTEVSSPNPGWETWLTGVAAVGPNNAWAVGTYYSSNADRFYRTLILHWDGTAWSIVPSPNPGFQNDGLYAVTALGANNVWAVGYQVGGTGYAGTLAVHWDGSTWSAVPSPNGAAGHNYLWGVDARAPTDVWAVGSSHIPLDQTVIEHYADPCAPPLPTNTPMPTTTPTATITPTATVTSTVTPGGPTPCPITFNDVPPGSTYYDWIRCLACRGIVGGYPCGGPGEPCPGQYYRPNNNVTRGQVSKIVASAAGFADPVPSTQQTFEDVPPSATFWLTIERLATRGIIDGYPCGGPFEPCIAPNNRPYFRPNNNVTRGQLSKITSGAAGWTETPTGQTFEDVPPGQTFYLTIERLAGRGIIQGYPCGGPFEPCVSPANRPYFRPNNNATRGQMAKIAALAFFPNCTTPTRR